MIENTSERDPLLHLAGSLGAGGFGGYVQEMEAAGQAQVVHSDQLPTQAPWATDEDRTSTTTLEDLGFVKGEPVPGDALFVRCTFPEGWRREGSDHAMWSYVVDDRGLRRVAIFYKAAFYDRSAHAYITDVGPGLASDVVYGDAPPALPGSWDVLTEDERRGFVAGLQSYLRQAAEHPTIYGKRAERARAILKLTQP